MLCATAAAATCAMLACLRKPSSACDSDGSSDDAPVGGVRFSWLVEREKRVWMNLRGFFCGVDAW